MSTALFAYGSLIFPDVYEAVTERARRGRPARLVDYERTCVIDATYPGIRSRAGAITEGVVYVDVTPAEIEALDVFEGDYYERLRVHVHVLEGRDPEALLEVDTYVIRETYAHLLSREPWDPGVFEREHKGAFLGRYAGFDWLAAADDESR